MSLKTIAIRALIWMKCSTFVEDNEFMSNDELKGYNKEYCFGCQQLNWFSHQDYLLKGIARNPVKEYLSKNEWTQYRVNDYLAITQGLKNSGLVSDML